MPKALRFDLTPFVGYRTGMSLSIQPYVQGTNPRVVLEPSPSYGLAFGLRIHEDDLVEFRWARQSSYAHVEGTNVAYSHQSVTLDQFHGDFSHEYTIDEWRSWAKPFVMLSVGGTRVSGSGSDFTRFSFGIGGGLRFYASRHVGFKVQAEWLPLVVDPQVVFVCGGGCVVHVGGTLSSQGEVIIGPMFRF